MKFIPTAFLLFSISTSMAFGQNCPPELLTLSSSGQQANANANLILPSVSADGRLIVFSTEASNLVPGDNNGVTDVFLRDRLSGTTELISKSATGIQGNGISEGPKISSDGRFILFSSVASNLVPGDNNGYVDAFLHDRLTGSVELVSLSSAGVQGNHNSFGSSVSEGGRYVVVWSLASNLVLGDTLGFYDIFLRDRQAGTTQRVSVSSSGVEANTDSLTGSISADSRYISFLSAASNLVPGDSNNEKDVFVHDRQTGQTQRVSISSTGAQANGGSSAGATGALSGDGRYVVFSSAANNLVPGDSNFSDDVFVRDRVAASTHLVSLSSSGTQANFGCIIPSISWDGRFVAFTSPANNLVAGDNNQMFDIFVRDRLLAATEMVSKTPLGVLGNGNSFFSMISADGEFVAFTSEASNLVVEDSNGSRDAFLKEVFCFSATIYCTAKVNSMGCTPAIGWSGEPSASKPEPFFVTASRVINNKPGLLVYSLTSGSAHYLGGYLCLGVPFERTGFVFSWGNPPPDDCSGMLSFDFNAWIQGGLDVNLLPGVKVYAQYIYADPADPLLYGLTDAIEFQIQP